MDKIKRISRLLETSQIGPTRIEIIGNNRINIEGCYGIQEYNDEIIKVNMPKGFLMIIGFGLEICVMQERSITVEGIIKSLEFEGNVA